MKSQYPGLFSALSFPGLILLPDSPRFTIKEVNVAFLRATNTKETDWNGKSIFEVTTPLFFHGAPAIRESLEQALRTKAPQKMGGQENSSDGHNYGTQSAPDDCIENIPLMDESGMVTGIFQMITPCIGNKIKSAGPQKAAESLPPSASTILHLNKIMDASLDVICVIDEAGYFRRINAACEIVWGYKPEELIGRLYTDFIYHEDHADSNSTAARLMAGNKFNYFENRYIHKNGNLVPMEWRASWVAEAKTRVGIGRDITEKKTALEQSHLNEMRFRALVQEGSDLIAILDEGANYTYVSPTSLSILGVHPEEYIGKNLFEFIHPEDKGSVVAAFDQLQTARQVKNIEFRFRNHEGGWRWIETTITNLINDAAVKGIVANSRDITDRKGIEQASSFKAELLNTIGQAVIATSLKGIINFWNNAAASIYGWVADEVIGKDINDIIPSLQSKARVAMIMRQFKSGHSCSGEFLVQLKDGGEFPAFITDAPFYDRDGKLTGIISISSDITERKQAEDELRKTESRYRTLFEQNLAGVYTSTLGGIILDCNTAFAKMLKYDSPVELLDTKAVDLYFSPGDRDAFILAVSNEKKLYNHEYILKCKDGSPLYVIENIVLREDALSGEKICDGILIDITERKLAELQLKYVNERFTNVSKATFDAVWDWDLNTNNLYLGDAFEHLFGYKLEKNETNISTWYEHLHAEDAEMVMNSINQVINDANNNHWKQEYRYIKANGEIAFVVDRGFVLRDEKGQAYRMVGAMHDSTKRKMNDFALQQSEARHRGLIVSQTNYLIRTDLESNYSYYNDKYFRDFGWLYDGKDLLGSSPMKSIMEYDQKRVMETVEKCLANLNQVFQVEIDKPSKEGGVRTTIWDFICLTDADGLPAEIQCVGIDISERKLAADAIRLSNERYDMIAMATNDCTWDWDLIKNEVERPGRKLECLLGYNEIEAAEVDEFWRQHVHPDDWMRINKTRDVIFKNPREKFWEDEYRFLKPDGSYALVYDRGYVIRNAQGNAIRMIGASRDISKERENESELKKLNDQLQKRAKELADSNAELEQFAYVASHDLQEPLRMVTSFLTQLEHKYADIIDDKGKKYIEFAVDGAKRMRHLILDLLEYSRVGKTEDDKEDIDVNDLVKEIQVLYRKQIGEKGAVFITAELPVIHSYKSPVRQVFQNLISNALKYSHTETPVQIQIICEELIEHWHFIITDNGIGIEKEYYDKIFIIFQRLHTKQVFPGTGMGLAITKKIIENLGGEIWLNSTPGKSSSFHFTISK